ncbi:MAG: 2TM domain-containing protein, partial [Flavobacteriaceae bacterium]|nr:2TM domain-containing protein [Flavobacteriaceae bacterium]
MNVENNESRENRYLRAKERVAEMKKFYSGLVFYVIFISFLGWLNYYTNQ